MNPAIIATIIGIIFLAAPADAATRVYYKRFHRPVITYSAPRPAAPTTATPAPAPQSSPVPAVDYVTQAEQEVLRLTNIQRSQNGLAPLAADAALANIARSHSLDMITGNYFSHTSLSGCSASCRLNNAGYGWQAYGENIHYMWGYTMTPSEAANKIVTDWMNSEGHRANILNGTFTRAGIGIAMRGTVIYSTTDYALPR